MDYNFLSPYVRYAVNHTLYFPFEVCERIIFDYEIILPQGGVCRFEYDGKVYMCKKGDVIFIRPGHEHRLLGVENSDFIQPHVHFDMITDAFSAKRYICFEKYENIPEEERYLLGKDVVDIDIPPVFTPENGEYLSVQLYELIEIFSAKGEFWQLLCKEKMLHILYIIFSQFDSNKKEESNKIEMLNIKSYIDGNYSQRITLDYLAERFLMNKFYIEVNFKKCFGVSVIKYYNNVRIEKACKLIKDGKRVSEVAEMLGFENIYAFSRAFKNIMGSSPTKYKSR